MKSRDESFFSDDFIILIIGLRGREHIKLGKKIRIFNGVVAMRFDAKHRFFFFLGALLEQFVKYKCDAVDWV